MGRSMKNHPGEEERRQRRGWTSDVEWNAQQYICTTAVKAEQVFGPYRFYVVAGPHGQASYLPF